MTIEMDDGSATRSRVRPRWMPPLGQVGRMAALVVVVVTAYHFTLLSFLGNLRQDTPLAYLPLVPLLTLITAVMRARRCDLPSPIKDRVLDLLIGVPLLVIALLLITVTPALMSAFYWSERLDVLSFGLFTIGSVVLVYGVTWCWRLRGPLGLLILMWPSLYLHAGAGLLNRITDLTNQLLGTVAVHLPLGVSPTADPSVFVMHPADQPRISVAVASACGGGNTLIGFALLGGVALLTVSGTRIRKGLWMLAGLAVAFAGNLVRLLSIMALAAAGHPSFALGAYHEVVGLLVFTVEAAGMLLLLPRFGLRTLPRQQTEPVSAGPVRPTRRARPRRIAAVGAVVAAVTTITAIADSELVRYAAFVDGTGAPTVTAFGALTAVPAGWSVEKVASYDWAERYFGPSSTFERYAITSPGLGAVFADVVRTPDRSTLDAYGLQNCYLFHNYDIRSTRRVDLGQGVTALLLDYADASRDNRWATVAWAWPVVKDGRTMYERIALTSDPHPSSPVPQGSAGGTDALRTLVLALLNGGSAAPGGEATYSVANATLQRLGSRVVAGTVSAGSTAAAPQAGDRP